MAKTKDAPAKAELILGYEIKTRGQYYSKDKSLKMFELTFFVPKEVEVQVRRVWKWFKSGKSRIKRSVPVYDKVNGRENAQHIIQRLLLPGALTKDYPDALGHKTCHIVSTKIASRPASSFADVSKKSVDEMTRSELFQFCKLHSLATPIDSFSAIEDARQAVQDSYDETKLYAEKEMGADDDLEVADDYEDPASGPGDGELVEDNTDPLDSLM